MSHKPKPSNSPYDVERGPWVYDDCGRQLPVVAVTRRSVVVRAGPERLRLRRRRLTREGVDTAAGTVFFISRYLQEEAP